MIRLIARLCRPGGRHADGASSSSVITVPELYGWKSGNSETAKTLLFFSAIAAASGVIER